MLNILAPAPAEVKPAEVKPADAPLVAIELDVTADDEWTDEYIAHLEAEHAADAAADFAAEHGYWPC